MRLLFEIDKKDYDPNGTAFIRPSARAIIIKDKKLAVIYSNKQKCYQIPGGGIESGEDPIEAMIREGKEEAGLEVIRETVREFGYVHRIQRGKHEPVFIQDNYYYLCEVSDTQVPTSYSENEKADEFEPVFVSIENAIETNELYARENSYDSMIERELRVMRIVQKEILNDGAY